MYQVNYSSFPRVWGVWVGVAGLVATAVPVGACVVSEPSACSFWIFIIPVKTYPVKQKLAASKMIAARAYNVLTWVYLL